jgi:hypothetical protein
MAQLAAQQPVAADGAVTLPLNRSVSLLIPGTVTPQTRARSYFPKGQRSLLVERWQKTQE